MSPSITPRCLKTFWRNGEAESKGEAEVTTLYYCHVQADFDYFEVAWDDCWSQNVRLFEIGLHAETDY